MEPSAIPGDVPQRENSRGPGFAAEGVRAKSAGCTGMPPSGQIDAAVFSDDILEFIRLLEKHKVHYLIVGGEAVIFHGYPRLTGDIDFLYESTETNTQRLFDCLNEFWNGQIPEISSASELMEENVIVQFGRPPNRLDLLSQIDAVPFSEAWAGRISVKVAGAEAPVIVHYLGKEALLKNKKASGRPKDLDDVQHLE
jgi:hypothetical protein